MAAQFRLPTFVSLSAHKQVVFSGQQRCLTWEHGVYPLGRNCRIVAASSSKPRGGRKVKTNEELCNDIREFISMVGLPEDRVPTMKQLSEHGRSDLAYIVRRRGYKLIEKLLTNSEEADYNTVKREKVSVEKHAAIVDHEETFLGPNENLNDAVQDISSSTDVFSIENSGLNKDFDSEPPKESTVHSLEVQNEKTGPVIEDSSQSTEVVVEDNFSRSWTVTSDYENNYRSAESSVISTLEERSETFIEDGDLETVDDNVHSTLHESDDVIGDDVVIQSLTSDQESIENAYGSAEAPNGTTVVLEEVAPLTASQPSSRDDNVAAELQREDWMEEGLDIETIASNNEVDINQLKVMLHQKELELSHLKEQIEKEKIALYSLQTKAEEEINKAQQLLSEKDAELNAVEENLSELEEVELEYFGEGEIVEVAGSFNGWHHKIKMDPRPSTALDASVSRKSRLWSILLWLYPGIYEIKFIVDGQWTIDSQKETVSKGGICNNILRVGR